MTRLSFPSATVFRVRRGGVLLVLASIAACAATNPDADLLERTAERTRQFWDHLSSVAITENVLQEKLDLKGKVILNNRATYDYLITVRSDSGGMLVDESRLATGQGPKKAPQGTLLTTQGFATLMTIFHPQFQPSYTFKIEGEEETAGRKLVRVTFVPRIGAPTPAILALKGRDYPIAWEGSAWIEPQSASVARLEANWKDPAEDLGLQSLSSEVQYVPISFRGQNQPYWLPTMAKIEVQTRHQHWRNTHQFSKYRLFSVDAESAVGTAPVNPSADPQK
ncbi:MAG TPA: hypothetical protein VLM42_00385 [Bryobacteraceae bacterium]|nr:hypothetical protein [Bryobacteraceae bacterium]